jgi:hypothetical protein
MEKPCGWAVPCAFRPKSACHMSHVHPNRLRDDTLRRPGERLVSLLLQMTHTCEQFRGYSTGHSGLFRYYRRFGKVNGPRPRSTRAGQRWLIFQNLTGESRSPQPSTFRERPGHYSWGPIFVNYTQLDAPPYRFDVEDAIIIMEANKRD